MLEVEHIRLGNLDDYFRVAQESRRDWTHHAAWVDVLAKGSSIGRGIYIRSRFTECDARPPAPKAGPSVPFQAPASLVAYPTVKLFNAFYRRKLFAQARRENCVPYDPVFFPLDGLQNWNRIYGPDGFYQYQCVVPKEQAPESIRSLLNVIAEDGQGSFLTVLKEFGDEPSPGLLSFPMPGTSLAVDFPNRGSRTLEMLNRLDEITSAAGGRVYPAKDARAGPQMLARGYPLDRFRPSIDSSFSSTFWRRNGAG